MTRKFSLVGPFGFLGIVGLFSVAIGAVRRLRLQPAASPSSAPSKVLLRDRKGRRPSLSVLQSSSFP